MTWLLLAFSLGTAQSHDAAVKQAFQLLLENKDAQAIALLDPLVTKHPNAADLHEMLGTAHLASAEKLAGEAAAAARRRTHLEKAATHLTRTSALTHVNRASNLDSLVEIYSPAGLDQPAAEETYARRFQRELEISAERQVSAKRHAFVIRISIPVGAHARALSTHNAPTRLSTTRCSGPDRGHGPCPPG